MAVPASTWRALAFFARSEQSPAPWCSALMNAANLIHRGPFFSYHHRANI